MRRTEADIEMAVMTVMTVLIKFSLRTKSCAKVMANTHKQYTAQYFHSNTIIISTTIFYFACVTRTSRNTNT